MRGLTLPEAAVRALRRAKARQAQELLGIGIQQGPETFIHATWDGGQVKPQALAKVFRRFCTEHRFSASLHTLRHTNASLLLASGADVKTAADRLGHANPSLLFNTYAHLILCADRAAAVRLNEAMGKES